GLSGEDVIDVCYFALLYHLGCTASADRQAQVAAGDDVSSRRSFSEADYTDVCTLKPGFVVLRGYKDYAMRFRGFLIGLGLALGRAHIKRSASTCPTIRPRRSRAAQRQGAQLGPAAAGASHHVPTLAHRQRRAARRYVAVQLDRLVLPVAETLGHDLEADTFP